MSRSSLDDHDRRTRQSCNRALSSCRILRRSRHSSWWSPCSALAIAALLRPWRVATMPQAEEQAEGRAPRPRKEKKGRAEEEGAGACRFKPDRTIEFTTDEGTWVSLDVSPDGKTIVFELLGDLYTVPIAGGEAKAITTGLAFDSQPQLFARRQDRSRSSATATAPRTCGSRQADGSDPRPLTKDKQSLFASPSWTPDGDYVLVSRQPQLPWGAFELWMYHVRGGSGVAGHQGQAQARRQAAMITCMPSAPSPRRDGKHLYYTKRNKLFNAYNNLDFPLSQVARRDRTTGDEDTITEAHGSGFRPVLSPDGTKLVYGTRVDNQTGLRIRDLASGEERWLKLPVQRDEQESRYTRDLIPGYAFTPDGKSVLAAYGGKIHRIDVADRRRPGDPVLGAGVAAGRLAAQLPDPGGRRPGAGAADPGARALARRQAPGVLGADEALRDGSARRQAPAALGRRMRASFTRAGRPTASRSPT